MLFPGWMLFFTAAVSDHGSVPGFTFHPSLKTLIVSLSHSWVKVVNRRGHSLQSLSLFWLNLLRLDKLHHLENLAPLLILRNVRLVSQWRILSTKQQRAYLTRKAVRSEGIVVFHILLIFLIVLINSLCHFYISQEESIIAVVIPFVVECCTNLLSVIILLNIGLVYRLL